MLQNDHNIAGMGRNPICPAFGADCDWSACVPVAVVVHLTVKVSVLPTAPAGMHYTSCYLIMLRGEEKKDGR